MIKRSTRGPKLHTLCIGAAALVCLSLGACSKSDLAGRSNESGRCEAPWREPNLSLNPGYVLVYQTMDNLSGIDKVLLIKAESDPFEKVIKSVADYAGKLAGQLEELDEVDDGIDLKGQSMPDVILQARKAIGQELRGKIGGPFRGAEGKELERSLLLMLDVGLSESRKVVRELARRETSKKPPTGILGNYGGRCSDSLERATFAGTQATATSRSFQRP